MGGGGSSSSSNQNAINQYADWFNNLNKQQGANLSNMIAQQPETTAQIQAGGLAPANNIWAQQPQSYTPRAVPMGMTSSGPTNPQGAAGALTGGNAPTGGLT